MRFTLIFLLILTFNTPVWAKSPVSRPVVKKTKKAPKSEGKRHKRAAYFSLIGSYMHQGKRKLQTTSDSTYEISEFTGTTFFFAGGVDLPYNDTWSGRVGLIVRSTKLTGDTAVENSASGYTFELDQKFIGIEGAARYSPPHWRRWSFLAGLELSKGTSIKLKVLKGTPINDSEVEMPFYGIISGGFFYALPFSENPSDPSVWASEVGLRFGTVVTADPVIFALEALVALKYAF